MKKLIAIIFSLQFLNLVCFSQQVSKENLQKQIEALRNEVFKSTEVFLNPANSIETRINAAKPYPYIYDEGQIAAAKKIVLNEAENPIIRAAALSKIVSQVPDEELLGTSVIKWVQDAKTPKVLRDEALNTLRELSFSGFALFTRRQAFTDALRTLTRDPDLAFRQFAFNFLLAHGDSFAQDLLINQLDNNRTDLLPTVEAIRVLTLNPHGDYLPSVYKVFLNPSTNKETKIEAIAVLGKYLPAKPMIISLLKDKKQTKDIRSIALSTVFANYPSEFAYQVKDIIIDESESDDLKVTAIVMETYKRQSNQEKAMRRLPDDFDKSVKKLSTSSKSSAMRNACALYLDRVQPNL